MNFRCRKCDTPFAVEMSETMAFSAFAKILKSVKCPTCGAGARDIVIGAGLSAAEDDERLGPVDTTTSIVERANRWRKDGEYGLSSGTIWEFMLFGTVKETTLGHPHDTDDLRRCALLLRRIPEWRARLPDMAGLEGWRLMAASMGDLVDSLMEETGGTLSLPAPRTAAMLRDVINRQNDNTMDVSP